MEKFMDFVEEHAFGIIVTIGVVSVAANTVSKVMTTKATVDAMKRYSASTIDPMSAKVGDKFTFDGHTYKVMEVTKF